MKKRYTHLEDRFCSPFSLEDMNMRRLLWAAIALALLLPVSSFAADSLLVDNLDAGYNEISGTWFGSTFGYLDSSRWCYRDTTPNATARFSATGIAADEYNVYYLVPSSDNSATNALYRVWDGTVLDSLYKNQNTSSGSFVFLGQYDLPGDGSGYLEAVNDPNVGSTGYAFRTDAALFEAVGDAQDIHLVHFYHDFDVVDPGDSSLWTFDFSNVGGDTLTVSDISTSTFDFTVTDPGVFPLEVQPGATVDVTVKFAPLSAGNFADSVQITSDDPDSTEVVRTVLLEGRSGVLQVDDGDPGYSEPVGITWTSSGGYDGDSRYAIVSTDTNATALYVPTIPSAGVYNVFYFFGVVGSSNSATGAKFKITHATGADSVYRNQNLRSGEYEQFLGQHQFNAGTGGTVEIINDPNAPNWGGYAFRADLIRLEPPTSGPDLYVIDYELDFGEVTVGQSKDLTFMAHNIGDASVSIDSIVFSNADFSAISPPASIAAGTTDDITIRFTPSTQTTYSGESVTIYNDDGEAAPSVYLGGVGVGNIVIIDNEDGAPTYTERGNWGTSSSSAYGSNSAYHTTPYNPPDTVSQDSTVAAIYTPDIPVSDYYDVWWIIVNTDWTDQNALYKVTPATASPHGQRVDQRFTANAWQYLGTYYLDAGTGNTVELIGDSLCTGPVIRADAVKFLQTSATDSIPPPAVTDLTVEKSAGDIFLDWSDVYDMWTGVSHYIIYRNTDPTFAPTSGDSVGEALTSEYLDAGAVGTDYYYFVRAVDNAGLKGDLSGRVGEANKDLLNAK
jgi:hypothetical protein